MKHQEMVPKGLEEYKDAKVFTREKFESIKEDEIERTKIGDVETSEAEDSVLKLQPKFAVLRKLENVEMETELEMGCGKGKYQLLAEINEKLENEEEEEPDEETREKMEEEEARSRQVYKPLEKTFDYRLKRTTDLKENSRVMLPKPLPTSEEAGMDTRRRTHMSTFNNYKEANCNKWGNQKSNLKENEENKAALFMWCL